MKDITTAKNSITCMVNSLNILRVDRLKAINFTTDGAPCILG